MNKILNHLWSQVCLTISLHGLNNKKAGRARFLRTQAESAQDFIGWEFLLEGMFIRTWSDIQTTHYKKLSIGRTGLRWITQLLLKFWGICWDL